VPRHNLLLGDPGSESQLPLEGLESVALGLADRLVRVGDVPTHAYFPIEGVISIVSSTAAGDTVEVAAVGREGLAAGVSCALYAHSPVDLLVQVPGVALRLDGERLRQHIESNAAFRRRWLEYLHMLITQMAQTAVCNRYHPAARRLAKWLLTVADRAETDTIPLTHEFASTMVGGNRPRVSMAMRTLRERHLIEYRRGRVRIIDRKGLTKAACECYQRVATIARTADLPIEDN
jgi:CRP-like cAMP-binding protein